MGLSFAKKTCCFPTDKFRLASKMWNSLFCCMCISQNLNLFCHCPFQTFFLPFSFPFSRSFYSCYLLCIIFFLAVPKNWVLTKDKASKYSRPLINYMYNGHFTTIFAPKLITLIFNLLHQNAVKIQNQPLCLQIYLSSTICLSRRFGDI